MLNKNANNSPSYNRFFASAKKLRVKETKEKERERERETRAEVSTLKNAKFCKIGV